MRDAGSVVTREQLIEDVWDMNWFGSTKTLDVHVSGLRRKLADDPADPRYLHTVPRRGLSLLGPSEIEPGARSAAGVSLRTTAPGAFAYVLLLVIVALEVPLALNISRRVDAEIKARRVARRS